MSARPHDLPDATFGARAQRTRDVHEAEEMLAEAFIENQLDLSGSTGPLDARLEGARFGDLTAGRLAYGRPVRLVCQEEVADHHVVLVLSGRASLSDVGGGVVEAGVGRGAVYGPGSRPNSVFSADCVLLAMKVPPARLDSEVTTLLGRTPPAVVRFDFDLRLQDEAGRRLLQVLDLLQAELADPVLGQLDSVDRHLETLVLQGLLIAQPSNLRDTLLAQGPAPGSVVRRAADLLQADPGGPWSSGRLAAEVHLSVRALQEGFSRELGTPPMPYLRQVRLQRVHEALVDAADGTTVGAVAARFGFVHLGRFAGHYLRRFGELPSVTLARAREERTQPDGAR